MAGARSAGLSGLAVAMVAAGGLLAYTAITNTSLVEGLRDVLQGRTPGGSVGRGKSLAAASSGLPPTVAVGPGETFNFPAPGSPAAAAGAPSSNPQIRLFVETALQQLGKPYRFGAAGPDAFDCSGLVTFALKRAGLDDRRRVSGQYLVWGGAVTIPRQYCSYGDLVCWSGHIGIAIDDHRMVHAPHAGEVVRIANIWWTPAPAIRRIRAGASKEDIRNQVKGA